MDRINVEAALKVIDGADLCQDYADFARRIVKALAGEPEPKAPVFLVGDIVSRPINGREELGMIICASPSTPSAISVGVEFFNNVGYHDGSDYGYHGKPGHCFNAIPGHLTFVARPTK